MKILNFGSCNIDYVYNVDHIVIPGETLASTGLELFPGGKGLNQSIAVARAGAGVYHAGCVGEDGGMLRGVLLGDGVDVSCLKTVSGQSGHAIIQLSSEGQNSILLYSGANGALTEEFIDEVLSNFEEGDFIILQNEMNDIELVIEKAAKKGMSIVFNPAPFSENLKNIDYNKIAYLILNEIEVRGLGEKETPEENLNQIKKLYPDTNIVLTVGSKGCIYSDSDVTFYHPAFSVDVVDTTAAGDTFIGYFIAEISKGTSVTDAIKIATGASALTVSKKGASTSIPFAYDVAKALKTFKPLNQSSGREGVLRDKINAYLDEHIKDAKLGELAKALGYSEAYTGRLVQRIMGMSFSKVLQDKRCALADKLLSETELSVEEIISRVGYENESFFRAVFKEKYGASPYQYKKQLKRLKKLIPM